MGKDSLQGIFEVMPLRSWPLLSQGNVAIIDAPGIDFAQLPT
jgi:hypothetical protein